MLDSIPGYEGTVAGGGGRYLPPPMPTVPMPVHKQASSPRDWQSFLSDISIPTISEVRARKAFEDYVSNKWYYSSGPVKNGVVTNMEYFTIYRYRLETFNEFRSTEWSQEPFTGQPVDASDQPAPEPWQIAAQRPAFFQDRKQTIRVPHTSSIKNCHQCLGLGRKPCHTCAGAGSKVCWMCNGSGFRQTDDCRYQCSVCSGHGRENCRSCSGNGIRQCDTCHGKRQLIVFINLNVKWSTEKDEFVAQDVSGLRAEKLKKVSGKELFKDSQYMVYPVTGFPDFSVAQASERLVREHQVKYAQTSRILQQRQTIELIPITKVSYKWKGKSNVYYVYGNELKVNTEDYPATCSVM